MNRYLVANCYRLFCQGRLPEQAPGNPNPSLQTNSNRQFRKVRDCEPRSPGRRGDRATILNQKTEATGAAQNSCVPAFLINLVSGGGEADDFLFAAAENVRRRDESDFRVFPGAGHQVAAATQVELVFDVLAMALDGFDTQTQRMRDLGVAKP